ncbi:MAG: hypothetical protein U5K56_08340 [Halioglobus sp.]|nr:hypothetical protein [Halioglobus sp.]
MAITAAAKCFVISGSDETAICSGNGVGHAAEAESHGGRTTGCGLHRHHPETLHIARHVNEWKHLYRGVRVAGDQVVV